MILKLKIKNLKLKGAYLPVILVMSTLFMAFVVALIAMASANVRSSTHYEKYISSLEVAEAGINYYMWHLSHDNADFCDGQGCTGQAPYGPFAHEYKDTSGKTIGSYELYITPPTQGEATTSVKSVSRIIGSPSSRTVIAELGMPSFAHYSFLTNTECWFGSNETTNGPIHSNVGIHFDGTANGIVSSSSATYTPSSSFGGDGQTHNGVWGSGGPEGFWVFPVPAVDFNRISVDLTTFRADAVAHGISLDQSKSLGYYLKLKSDNTIDVYKVTKERTSGINTTFLRTYSAPSNGVIYVNDNVWVDGTYSGQITIAAETQNGQNAKIKIEDNILYSKKDGSAKVGLVSQGDLEVPSYAVDNLEIDAALLSQKGHIWFPQADNAIKNSISIYGAISSFDYWTWTWVSGNIVTSGYRTTTQTYDPYFTLGPPPEFPSTGNFAILSWREE